MKILKKFLFYIIMIMTFALSFSSEDAKIYLDRKIEPAKLKIGVTKLKTKELPLDFNIEEKTIFGYLPDSVTDNHLIFISETLDEMPSLSTTNGRRSINNIKKYLTKDIKVAPKFTYQVLVGDKENGIEEGKKYLLINCKTVLSGVYVYVVEKDTYHVKEVYKGKFNVPVTLEETVIDEYGEIKFFSNHDLRDGDRITSTTGENIVVVRGNQNTEQSFDKAIITGGTFPKKVDLKTSYILGASNKIRITLGTGVVKEIEYGRSNENFEFEIDTKLTRQTVNEKLKFYTIKNSEYLYIQLMNWQNYSELETSIKIEYFWKGTAGSYPDTPYKIQTFSLNIASKENVLEETRGSIEIDKEHEFNSTEKILSYDGSFLKIDGVAKDYIKLSYGYPKKYIPNNEEEVYLQIIQNNIIVSDDMKLGTDGSFSSKSFDLKRATKDSVIGVIQILADSESDYLKFKIKMDKPFRDDTNNNIKLRYIKKTEYGYEILKVDEVQLNIEPRYESGLEETRGGIFVNNASGLNAAIISADSSGNLTVGKGAGSGIDISQISQIGELPQKVIFDNSKADWGERQRLIVTNESYTGSENDANTTQYIEFYGSNKFFNGENRFSLYDGNDDASLILSTLKEHTDIYYIDYAALGIRAVDNNDYLEFSVFHFNDGEAQTVLNASIKLEYQAEVDGEWVTKKTDVLKIIIQPKATIGKNPEIIIKSPPVWYDYSQSSALSNINHFRKVELLNSTATTLNKDGSNFIKNDGWIEVKNIPEYNYFYRHKIEVNAGDGEVIKNTDDNGKTISSTFVKIGNGNKVMFAYDGNPDKTLSFGLSEYNYLGGTGKVYITQYNSKNEIDIVNEYDIKIEKFDPLPYVDNTKEININSDYIKAYAFNQELGVAAVDIEYGEVGIAALDTRITNEFGGEGIELRVAQNVLLIGEGEFSSYSIPAILEFKPGTKIKTETIDGKNYSILKKDNKNSEEAISEKLILHIDTQEALIPKGRFKIVEATENNKSPLKVGVVVNNDNDTYFKEVTDLYLDLTEQRFVRTDIIFENTQIQNELTVNGEMSYIKLDKANANGTIVGYEGTDIHWGRIDGEVIDIPVNKLEKKATFKVELYDNDYKLLTENIYDIPTTIEIAGNKFELYLKDGETYIQFRLKNDDSSTYKIGSGGFYLRFSQVKSDGTSEYLFTQKYNVTFNDGIGISKSINIIFKNPAMYIEEIGGATGIVGGPSAGKIYIDETKQEGEADSIGNHNTNQDQEIWWDISGEISYPNGGYIYEISDSREFPWESTLDDVIVINGIESGFIKDNTTNKYTLYVGIDKTFNYESKKNTTFYIRWKKGENGEWEKLETINVKVDDFDPTYYGKIYPVDGIDDTNQGNYESSNNVGDGYEELKTDIKEEVYYIDLGTTYRDYQRYAGVLKLVDDGNLNNLKIKPISNVVARASDGKEIQGRIVFKEEGNIENIYLSEIMLKPTEKIDEVLLTPEKYRLYFEVNAEEYGKLMAETEYNLYSGQEKNVLKIGFENKNSPYFKNLNLKKPLNFTTSSIPFVIYAEVLDFGKINILNNSGSPIEKVANTNVFISGKDIENVKLNLDIVENKIFIYKINSDGTQDTEKRLEVNKLQLDDGIVIDETAEKKTRQHILSGNLRVPLDSDLGNYEGIIYINTTIEQ